MGLRVIVAFLLRYTSRRDRRVFIGVQGIVEDNCRDFEGVLEMKF